MVTFRHGWRLYAFGCAVSLLCSVSCMGVFRGANGDDDGGGANGANGANGVNDQVAAALGSFDRPALRRLTASQYLKTVQAVFPNVKPFPAITLPDEVGKVISGNTNEVTADVVATYDQAAKDVATAVTAQGDVLGCGAQVEDACLTTAINKLGRQLFRRPLTAEETARYITFFKAQATALTTTTKATSQLLRLLLNAPSFLYVIELGEGNAAANGAIRLSDYEIATRLSLFLRDAAPDDALLDAAASGDLSKADGVTKYVTSVLASDLGRQSVLRFFRDWFSIGRLRQISKDPSAAPEWSPALITALENDFDEFIRVNMLDGPGTVEALLTSRSTQVSSEVASLYGVASSGNAVTTLPSDQRGGVLTTAAFLASFAGATEPSPVRRGVFVLDGILCQASPPPPPNVALSVPAASGTAKTNRQRLEAHLTQPTCAACHKRIDGIGLTFENFDTLGKVRTTDNGEPVDTSGEVTGIGQDGAVKNAVELTERLAKSDVVRLCVAKHWYRFAVGRFEQDTEADLVKGVAAEATKQGGSLVATVAAILQSPAFMYTKLPAPLARSPPPCP